MASWFSDPAYKQAPMTEEEKHADWLEKLDDWDRLVAHS